MRLSGLVVLGALVLVGGIVWLVYDWSPSPASAVSQDRAALTAMSQSGISGSAQFVPTSNGQATNVTVQLSGLQPDAVYGVTINNGACLGPRLYILSGVIGDANGQGTSTTTVPAQPVNTWFLAVHATAASDAPVVACGQAQVGQAGGSPLAPVVTATPTPSVQVPSQNQQPFQLPNGGGGPPRTPIPTPGR